MRERVSSAEWLAFETAHADDWSYCRVSCRHPANRTGGGIELSNPMATVASISDGVDILPCLDPSCHGRPIGDERKMSVIPALYRTSREIPRSSGFDSFDAGVDHGIGKRVQSQQVALAQRFERPDIDCDEAAPNGRACRSRYPVNNLGQVAEQAVARRSGKRHN